MTKRRLSTFGAFRLLAALIAGWPLVGSAQVPVDEAGNELAASENIPLLSASELEQLVGPIALYPDDLLAIILPATTFPLQLVQAERFLQDLKHDPGLEPDTDWDDSIIALINYPEAVELLTEELDQTWRLGEAVVAQQTDVIAAVEAFRDRAYAAGNLQSDSRQTVVKNDGVIEISPVEEDVIYVPYYEPEKVVVYQAAPAYYYYPRPYPVYYYPYPYGYSFNNGFFWGVTTAFAVGWFTDSLHVYHHSYYGHPYYGHSYYNHHYWYRHPSVHAHNNYYYGGHSGHGQNNNNHWQPHSGSTVNAHDQRVTRNRQYPGTGSTTSTASESARIASSRQNVKGSSNIKFQDRGVTSQTRATTTQVHSVASNKTSANTQSYKFRERPMESHRQNASQESRSIPNRENANSRSSNQAVKTSRLDSTKQNSRASQTNRSSQPPTNSHASYSSQSQQPKSSHSGSHKSASNKSASNTSDSSKSGPKKSAGSSRGSSQRR